MKQENSVAALLMRRSMFCVAYQSIKQYFRKIKERDFLYEENTKYNQNNICMVDGFAGGNNDDFYGYLLYYLRP